jgi:GTPase SAR1 family protein
MDTIDNFRKAMQNQDGGRSTGKRNPIKITILGNSGSGKTCYLHAMTSMLQIGGTHGFTVMMTSDATDNEIRRKWQTIMQGGENRWPIATSDELKVYPFTLNYSLQPIVEFDWIDYRGGILSPGVSEIDEEDVERLTHQVRDSDCIFFCISGEHINLDKIDPLSIALNADVAKMNNLIAKINQRRKVPQSVPFPVCVVITKADLLLKNETSELKPLYRKLNEIGKKMFPALYVKGTGWTTMVCPVTLGTELKSDLNNGRILPKNVHIPIVFAIQTAIIRKKFELQDPNRTHHLQYQTDGILINDVDALETCRQALGEELKGWSISLAGETGEEDNY